MPNLTGEASASGESSSRLRLALALGALALVYAFLAGFHTTDFDTGWHLATGRFVLQHHYVPTTDQFSYTARGVRWIYPPLPGIVFYLLYKLAGWSALSWLTAIACVAAVALAMRRDEPITNALAIIAVPAIAYRTVARADLFNTVIFAAMLHVMWNYFHDRHARLWLFPLLMLLWANVHLGFIAGFGILIAYVGMEALELPFAERRDAAIERLRRAWPWLLLSVPATCVNPFGWRIYRGVLDQPLVSQAWNYLVGEFAKTPLSTVRNFFDWRDPQTSYWWLMLIAVIGIVVAIARKQLGPAVLLAGAAYVSLSRARFQAMFALVVIVVAGAVLSEFVRALSRRELRVVGLTSSCLLAALVAVRSVDLVTDRYYVYAADPSVFGAGPSWWYPEGAADFVLREHLPTNIFNDFNVGAFLTFKLGADYPVYSDNRAIPFGIAGLFHQRRLMQQQPDSEAWQQEADKWKINTILVSVARYGGLGSFPLGAFCSSRQWKPVYLDDVSAVFLRDTPQNAPLIQRLRIDCATVKLSPHIGHGGWRGRAEEFQFLADSAAIYFLLGRDQESFSALDRAQQLFPDDAGLHLNRGQLFQSHGQLPQAEGEYRAALRLKQTSVGWYALGLLLASEKRWPEAEQALTQAANLDVYPHGMYLQLASVDLAAGDARAALAALQEAERTSPFRGDAAPFGAGFAAQIAETKSRAWMMLGNRDRAAQYAREAEDARQRAQQAY